jgi:hypothetical protein
MIRQIYGCILSWRLSCLSARSKRWKKKLNTWYDSRIASQVKYRTEGPITPSKKWLPSLGSTLRCSLHRLLLLSIMRTKARPQVNTWPSFKTIRMARKVFICQWEKLVLSREATRKIISPPTKVAAPCSLPREPYSKTSMRSLSLQAPLIRSRMSRKTLNPLTTPL